MKEDNKGSIYVCHTYYHVMVAVLKELNKPENERYKATMVLSTMSTDFESLEKRLIDSGVFKEVILFEEKRDEFFPELMKHKEDRGNALLNMLSRIKYTKMLAKLEEPYVPVDFHNYSDIYIFCDSDPIGIYLNQKRIKYHAVEDGLDTLKPYVQAKFDNRSNFRLKKFFSMKLNLIFICDGYSKYCIDMEVNDRSVIDDDFPKYVEVPRKKLFEELNKKEIDTVIGIFVPNREKLEEFMDKSTPDGVLLLTEPLCSLDVREQLFKDLIEEYKKEGTVYIKPHPRDELDYNKLYSDLWVFDRALPMEMLGLFDKIHFKKVVSVYTQLGLIDFVDEKVMLGHDFMDKYEDPSIHRKTEILEAEFNN